MKDAFRDHASGLTTPPTSAEVITPDDAADLGHATRAIYVGQGGDLVVQLVSGDTVTLANTQSGSIYPLRARRVLATGTSATFLIGMR